MDAAPPLLAALSSADRAVRAAAIGVASALATSSLLAPKAKSRAKAQLDALRGVFAAVEAAAESIEADLEASNSLLRRIFESAAKSGDAGAADDGDMDTTAGAVTDEEDRCVISRRTLYFCELLSVHGCETLHHPTLLGRTFAHDLELRKG